MSQLKRILVPRAFGEASEVALYFGAHLATAKKRANRGAAIETLLREGALWERSIRMQPPLRRIWWSTEPLSEEVFPAFHADGLAEEVVRTKGRPMRPVRGHA